MIRRLNGYYGLKGVEWNRDMVESKKWRSQRGGMEPRYGGKQEMVVSKGWNETVIWWKTRNGGLKGVKWDRDLVEMSQVLVIV